MDNVTHTLVGLAFGDAVALATKKKRVPIWIASAIANNLPDLDVFLTSTVFRSHTGYLLHHRGHSHTFFAVPLFALALFLMLRLFWKKEHDIPWAAVAFVCFAGPALHLFADFWNSYGVHPFWPWWNGWLYGDLVFIVEPWIWALLVPPLLLRVETRVSRALLAGLLALITTLAWVHQLVNWQAAFLFTFFTAAWLLAQKFIPRAGVRIGAALVGLAALLGGLGFVSARVKEDLHLPADTEIAANPFPANPLCWNVVSARLGEKEYRASLAVVAPFPDVLPAEECPRLFGQKFTTPFAPNSAYLTREKMVVGEFRAPSAELGTLAEDCRIRAFLRFARIPFWKREGNAWIVGDLRFDRDESIGFGEEIFPDGPHDCPGFVPPWEGRFLPR